MGGSKIANRTDAIRATNRDRQNESNTEIKLGTQDTHATLQQLWEQIHGSDEMHEAH